MKPLLNRIPASFFRHLWGRVILLLVFLAALAIVWWTWLVRYPLIGRQQSKLQAIYQLEKEVELTQMKWSAAEAAQVTNQVQTAEARLFTGETNLARWLDQLHPTTNFTVTVNLQNQPARPHPLRTNEVLLQPALLDLEPAPASRSGGSFLSNVLVFVEKLATNQQKRVDLVELAVRGDGGVLTNAQVGLNLWRPKRSP